MGPTVCHRLYLPQPGWQRSLYSNLACCTHNVFPHNEDQGPKGCDVGQALLPNASEKTGAKGPRAGSSQVKCRFLDPSQTPGPLLFLQAHQGILRPIHMCGLQLLQWDSNLVQGQNLLPSPLRGEPHARRAGDLEKLVQSPQPTLWPQEMRAVVLRA